MKRYGVSAVLGVLGVQVVLGMASCAWSPFAEPDYREEQEQRKGDAGVAGSGNGGAGGDAGVDGGGTGGTGGDCDCVDDGDPCTEQGCPEDPTKCVTTPLSEGEDCGGGRKCTAMGACLVPDGGPCSTDANCESEACIVGICRRASGAGCVDAVECASNYCPGSTKMCSACSANSQCKSKACEDGVCRAALGEPCGDDLKCEDGSVCEGGRCKGLIDTSCAKFYQCQSNYCPNGTCVACSAGQCGGASCTGGVCQLGADIGDYCIDDENCASGNCTGFPRRCAPAP